MPPTSGLGEDSQVPDIPLRPELDDIIYIPCKDDTEDPNPIDITVLTVDDAQTLVVADWRNQCLKSVCFMKKEQQMYRLKLSGKPYQVCMIAGNRVAATVFDYHISVAEVSPGLVFVSNAKTSRQYKGITSLPNSTLAVTSYPSPAVDILDLSGNILRSFTPHNTSLYIMQCPYYLCATHDGHILVSDFASKSVYCMTSEGGIVFTYKPTGDEVLRYPRGITVTDTGDILLVDWGSKNIIQLTPGGTFVRHFITIADGLGQPSGICVDDTNKLYVCDRATSSERIKVFLPNEKDISFIE